MQGIKIGLSAGSSMDLLTGWNFEMEADRDIAMKQIEEETHMPVIGSPPSTYFSMLQEFNKFNMRHDERWLARFDDNLIKAIDHIKFCIKLYIKQVDVGLALASRASVVSKVFANSRDGGSVRDPRVQVAYADQCQFGQTAARTAATRGAPPRSPQASSATPGPSLKAERG